MLALYGGMQPAAPFTGVEGAISDLTSPKLLQQLETQALMSVVEPDKLPVMATSAISIAQSNVAIETKKKDKAAEQYVIIMLALDAMERHLEKLHADLEALLERQAELLTQHDELAERLDAIDSLIGEDGTYDRAKAIGLIQDATGKKLDPNMSDADLQALLLIIRDQTRIQFVNVESEMESIAEDIRRIQQELDQAEIEARQYQGVMNDPTATIEQLSAKAAQALAVQEQLTNGKTLIANEALAANADAFEQEVAIDLNF